jgi:hypothetical protein
VSLTEKAHAQRQPAARVEDVIDGVQVVEDLPYILRTTGPRPVDLEEHQLREGRLSPLNPAGQDSFPTHQGTRKQMGVGKAASSPSKFSERAIGRRELAHQPASQLKRRRQRRR